MALICGTPTPATTRVVQIEPGPTPDLDRVDARVDERLGAGPGGDVAADDLDAVVAAEVLLHPGDHVEHRALVAVGGVDDEQVDAGVHEQPGPLVGVLAHAERRADDEPPVGVLRGVAGTGRA